MYNYLSHESNPRVKESGAMDKYWFETIKLIGINSNEIEAYLPDEMLPYIKNSKSFSEDPEPTSRRSILCVHKGLIAKINTELLCFFLVSGEVIFANEVFVIYEINPNKNLPFKNHIVSLTASLNNFLKSSIKPYEITKLVGRNAISMGNETILTTLISGEKIYLDSTDISLTPHIIFDGYWENWITKPFKRALRPGMNVVDIGSNCGYYTLIACNAVGPSGSVTAIDANPKMTSLLHSSISVNGFLNRAKVIHAAVHETEGLIDFAIPKRFKGSATTFTENLDFSEFNETFEIISVRKAPLNKLLNDAPIDIMKIDAEGAEPMIIRGADKLLRDSRNLQIFMEFAPAIFVSIISGADFLDYLEKLGFSINVINSEGNFEHASRDALLSLPSCDLFLEKK